jgi:hypothetical protein
MNTQASSSSIIQARHLLNSNQTPPKQHICHTSQHPTLYVLTASSILQLVIGARKLV